MIEISVILFLIIRIFSNPIANTLQKKLSTEMSPELINFCSYTLLSLSYLPYISKYILPQYLTYQFIMLVIIAGLLCSLGTLCMIKAIKIGELSVLGPINSYKSVVGLIVAIIFLKEIPSIFALIGIILVIAGSKIIFDGEREGFTFKLLKRKDIQLRLAALVLTGVEAVILKKIILISSIEACFIFWCFMGMFWSFVFMLTSKQKFIFDYKSSMFQLIIISICLGFMQYSTNYVFKYMNVGYALALFQLSIIITVWFGHRFFMERDITRKLIGSLIMIIGSAIIILN